MSARTLSAGPALFKAREERELDIPTIRL